MKFILSCASSAFSKEDKALYETIGFEFEIRHEKGMQAHPYPYRPKDISPVIKLDSIAELMEFIDKFGAVIVNKENGKNTILIYDSFIE